MAADTTIILPIAHARVRSLFGRQPKDTYGFCTGLRLEPAWSRQWWRRPSRRRRLWWSCRRSRSKARAVAVAAAAAGAPRIVAVPVHGCHLLPCRPIPPRLCYLAGRLGFTSACGLGVCPAAAIAQRRRWRGMERRHCRHCRLCGRRIHRWRRGSPPGDGPLFQHHCQLLAGPAVTDAGRADIDWSGRPLRVPYTRAACAAVHGPHTRG